MGKRQRFVDKFPSFPCLVAGRLSPRQTVQAMADRSGVDHATLGKWMRGRTKRPPEDIVRRWAEAMEVPIEEALTLILEDQIRRLNGKAVPLPDLSFIRPGPRPRGDSVRSLRKLMQRFSIRGGSDPRKPTSTSDNAQGLPRPGDGQKAALCQVRPKEYYDWYPLPLAA